MKIKMKKFSITPNNINEVTSDKVFKPRKCKDSKENWRFHEQGIFSREIFGKIGVCVCGETKTPGWCPKCGCRVLNKDKMPDFYISCETRIPYINADYKVFGEMGPNVKKIMSYNAFVYDGEVIDFDLETLDITIYKESGIKIGTDAVLALDIGADQDWIIENTVSNIPIPHPIFRPITETNGNKYILGPLNDMFRDLLFKRNQLISFRNSDDDSKLKTLAISKMLCEKYNEIILVIFGIIAKGKKSLVSKELIGQSLTGAIRSVITNNFNLDEDDILIGGEFVQTLFPVLYKKYDGDFEKINKELINGNYHVLTNRPPSIGQLSIIAMKPQINLNFDSRFVVSTNPIIFEGLAADTDGDVFLIIALYSKEANLDAEKLLPSFNYIGGADGFIRNNIPEDLMYAWETLKNQHSKLKNKKLLKEVINIE